MKKAVFTEHEQDKQAAPRKPKVAIAGGTKR